MIAVYEHIENMVAEEKLWEAKRVANALVSCHVGCTFLQSTTGIPKIRSVGGWKKVHVDHRL